MFTRSKTRLDMHARSECGSPVALLIQVFVFLCELVSNGLHIRREILISHLVFKMGGRGTMRVTIMVRVRVRVTTRVRVEKRIC